MANIETNVKKYITSLLTSTPLVVTIHQLNKDYRNTIGEAIPYQKLGYNSLEHLLHCIPDTVQVRGTGPTAVVTPVISEKSAHVNQLVTSQKITVKNRFGSSQKRQKNFFPHHGYSYQIQKPKPVQNAPSQLPARKMQYPIKKDISPVTKPSPPSVTTHNSTYQSTPSPIHNNEPVHNNSISPYRYNSTKDCNKPVKETNLLSNTKQQVDSNRLEKNENSTFLTTNAKRIKSKTIVHDLDRISEDQIENSVPLQIRNNLRSLIKACPEGIWCAEVPEKYRKMFRTELNYQELGFKSLIHLCVCLSSIFHYVRPSMDDYKLYDRSRPLPECAEKHFTMASYGASYSKTEADHNSALPSLDWSDVKKFLPQDIFMPGQEIPRTFLSHEVKENDTIDVLIGEIYDLSKFWVYTTDPKLDELMDEMQEFYKTNAQEYLIPDHLIKEGIYCVQVIFGEYHRALVVDTMPELKDTIRVVFIDYGSMTKVSTRGLCFLLDRFGKLEAQAIRCRLANVFPMEEGLPWSKEACRAFRKMVNERDLTAKINYINWEDQYIEVYLADVTDEDNIFYINDQLVEEGYAQQPGKERKQPIVDPIYEPIVKYLHLFPTFLELEHGLAPSTSEMEIFHECDLPINFCYPQYFSVDHSQEEGIIRAAEAFHEKNCIRERRRHHFTPNHCDIEQFKVSQELDLSIFGELRQEIEQFLSTSAKEECSEDGDDKDFEDADEELVEEPEGGCFMFNMLMGGVKLKDEEAIKALKEDLLVAEDIMNEINSICQVGHPTNELDTRTATKDCNLQKNEEPDNETCSAVIDNIKSENLSDVKTEWSDVSDSAGNQVQSLIHPLSAMTFDDETKPNDLSYDLQLPDVHLENNKLILDEDYSLSVINRLKLELDRKIKDFINDEVYYDEEVHVHDFTEKKVGDDEKVDEANASTRTNLNKTFLQEDKDVGCDSSGESSSSTTYESPFVAKTQYSWSNFSDISAETISELGKSLRGSYSSESFETFHDTKKKRKQILHCQSVGVQTPMEGRDEGSCFLPEDTKTCAVQTSNRQSVGIQTPMEGNHKDPRASTDEARSCVVRTNRQSVGIQTPMEINGERRQPHQYDTTKASDHQTTDGVRPYVNMYPSWAEVYYNNPYYSMRYASVVYEQQYAPPRNGPPGLPPPPGFLPQCAPPRFPGRNNYQPYPNMPYGQQHRPTGYYGRPDIPPGQMAPPQQYNLPPRMMQGYNQSMPMPPDVAGAPTSASLERASAPRRDFYDVYNEQQLQKQEFHVQ